MVEASPYTYRIGSWDTVKGELYSAEFELKCSLVIIYLLDELSPFCSIWHRNDAVEGSRVESLTIRKLLICSS